jgi:hypothetical protein
MGWILVSFEVIYFRTKGSKGIDQYSYWAFLHAFSSSHYFMLAGNGEISSEKSHCSTSILNVNYTVLRIDESQHQLSVIRIREIFKFRGIACQGVDNEGTVTYTFRGREQ